MGFFFRFQNLNPILYRIYKSRFHTHSHNLRLIQALGSSQLYESHRPLTTTPPPPDSPTYKIPKRWHVGHSHHNDRSGKEGENIFRLGLAADIGLATGKALTGYISGSTAIIADAAHSISDVVLSGVALLSFKAARVPKDKEHPYGHGKFETLGALGISCMLLATAGGIAWHALHLLLELLSAAPEIGNQSWGHEHMHNHPHGGHHLGIDMEHPILALSMTIISISIKEGLGEFDKRTWLPNNIARLYWITKRAGEREGSGLMKANAWHHRADAVSSFVALIGVGGSILGVKFLDPLAGIVVSGMILKAGLETGYQSVLELVDAAVPSQQLDPYRQTILQVEGVKGCNHLRGRQAGSSLYLDVNIEVDPFSSVSAAHDVGENVRREIQKLHPEVSEVFIHIEPAISLFSGSATDQQGNMKKMDCHGRGLSLGIEDIITNLFSTKFPEKMVLERITRHFLPDKILLQIEVSMPPDILIQDAITIAEEAEREILQAACDAIQVCILLRLGQTIQKLHNVSRNCNVEGHRNHPLP